MKSCSIENCGREVVARGVCSMHYSRWFRNGDFDLHPRQRVERHGTANEYANYGCRCQKCRDAWAAYHSQLIKGTCPQCGGPLANKYVSSVCFACHAANVEAPHGTVSRAKRCKCDLCRAASAKARRELRYRNPDQRERENRKRMERYYAAKR